MDFHVSQYLSFSRKLNRVGQCRRLQIFLKIAQSADRVLFQNGVSLYQLLVCLLLSLKSATAISSVQVNWSVLDLMTTVFSDDLSSIFELLFVICDIDLDLFVGYFSLVGQGQYCSFQLDNLPVHYHEVCNTLESIINLMFFVGVSVLSQPNSSLGFLKGQQSL